MTFIATLPVDLAERVCSASLAVPDGNGPNPAEGDLNVRASEEGPETPVRVVAKEAHDFVKILETWWGERRLDGEQPRMQATPPGNRTIEIFHPEDGESKESFLTRTAFAVP